VDRRKFLTYLGLGGVAGTLTACGATAPACAEALDPNGNLATPSGLSGFYQSTGSPVYKFTVQGQPIPNIDCCLGRVMGWTEQPSGMFNVSIATREGSDIELHMTEQQLCAVPIFLGDIIEITKDHISRRTWQ
jgi:hypothetical protein